MNMRVFLAYANGHWIGWVDLDGKVVFSTFGQKMRVVVEELYKATYTGKPICSAYPHEIPEEVIAGLRLGSSS